MARNITIALPEDLAKRLRIRAAEEDMSVSRYISTLLERELTQEPAAAVSSTHGGPAGAQELPGYWEAFERWKKAGGEPEPGPR